MPQWNQKIRKKMQLVPPNELLSTLVSGRGRRPWLFAPLRAAIDVRAAAAGAFCQFIQKTALCPLCARV